VVRDVLRFATFGACGGKLGQAKIIRNGIGRAQEEAVIASGPPS
jgi:hypothetical protein